MDERMTELENKIKSAPQPDVSEPKSDKQDVCFSCKGAAFWRKNEPGSKWICGRCHPPVPGLDVIFRNE